MTGNRLSRAIFFWPAVLLIRLGQSVLEFSQTWAGRHTVLPLFRAFCRLVLYARPYFLKAPRTNDVVTPLMLSTLIERHTLIAAIPCVCRAGRASCANPLHGEHEVDVCLSFGLAALIQIGSGLGKRLSSEEAKALCARCTSTGLTHHAIYSFGSLLEVCNCCADTCSH